MSIFKKMIVMYFVYDLNNNNHNNNLPCTNAVEYLWLAVQLFNLL